MESIPDKPNFDPDAFRDFEHVGWNRLYPGYHDRWEHLTTQAIPRLPDAAGVADAGQPDDRRQDLAQVAWFGGLSGDGDFTKLCGVN